MSPLVVTSEYLVRGHSVVAGPERPPTGKGMSMSDVRSTHWAENDRVRYARFAEALPAALEGSHDLWQRRVDAPELPRQSYTPHGPRSTYVYPITATRYESESWVEDGVHKTRSQPVEPRVQLTLLVAADGLRQAFDRANVELEQHYPGVMWALGASDAGVLVLDGTGRSW